MFLAAETALLTATRNRLIEGLDIAPSDIDIELDDTAPAMAGDRYYALSPASAQPGRYSPTGDQITHDVFGVRVAVIHRIGDVARDRRRTVFLDRLRGINHELSQVHAVLRFDYATIRAANTELAKSGIIAEFVKPLTPLSIDQRPRMVAGEMYGASKLSKSGDPVVCMLRGITFGGAEFIGRFA